MVLIIDQAGQPTQSFITTSVHACLGPHGKLEGSVQNFAGGTFSELGKIEINQKWIEMMSEVVGIDVDVKSVWSCDKPIHAV